MHGIHFIQINGMHRYTCILAAGVAERSFPGVGGPASCVFVFSDDAARCLRLLNVLILSSLHATPAIPYPSTCKSG